MVVDYDMLCDSLDISFDSLMRGSNSYAREHVKLLKKYGDKLTRLKDLAILMGLPNDEQIAIIRERNYFKIYPEYFTWDGPTKKAEQELTPLLEK